MTTWRFTLILPWWERGFTRAAVPAWFVWTWRRIEQDMIASIMKALTSTSIVAACCIGCSTTRQSRSNANLLPALRPYVNEVANELGTISAERKAVLGAIASNIVAQLDAGKTADLTFICSHNSRRSHMSQIWAQTAAYYYGLDRVRAFSGGTQATACNCRTVAAMRRA